jgi:hypothetical protein
MDHLKKVDPGAAAVARFRYFAGLRIEETAAALGVSAPTGEADLGWIREAIETGLV